MVELRRGEVWWAGLRPPVGSEPGFQRPVLIVQSDRFNASRIRTVVAAAISSNLRLAEAPGNLLLRRADSGLPKDSVINVSQVVTIDRDLLQERVGRVPDRRMNAVDHGLRLVLAL